MKALYLHGGIAYLESKEIASKLRSCSLIYINGFLVIAISFVIGRN